jgi:DNA-directed RNA polymerase subunit beta
VVVSQLIRSPGVYFEAPTDRATGRPLAMAKLIPDRGAWMEFETRKNDYIILKFNRKRTVPITVFLRALAAVDDGLTETPLNTGSDEEILSLFQDIDNNPDRMFIASSLRQEPSWDLSGGTTIAEAALIEFFKRMRPGDPATLENARQFLEEQLFDQRHYDLERVGRYKLNQKLDLQDKIAVQHRTVSKWDVVRLVRRMIMINNGIEPADDIDHLGNRRVKTVGELIQNKLRIGLRRMERVIKERMSIRDQDQTSPVSLINIRPVVAALREFFGSSQLSQFMDQTNPLAELRHKRTLSALGPGGLRRERAGFDVRDVHHSHYGRICPIETPEGPNIGLIGRLASFARVNEYVLSKRPTAVWSKRCLPRIRACSTAKRAIT